MWCRSSDKKKTHFFAEYFKLSICVVFFSCDYPRFPSNTYVNRYIYSFSLSFKSSYYVLFWVSFVQSSRLFVIIWDYLQYLVISYISFKLLRFLLFFLFLDIVFSLVIMVLINYTNTLNKILWVILNFLIITTINII